MNAELVAYPNTRLSSLNIKNYISSHDLNELIELHDNRDLLVARFESEFGKYVPSRYPVALSSGTASLHLALRVLNIGLGDEVICPTFTFAATANAICYVGAKPVFLDCEPNNWNIGPQKLNDLLESKSAAGCLPKAVIVVHSYGLPAQSSELAEICRQYEVPLIEDAAGALGSTYKKQMIGTHGLLAIYSFNHNKIINTGGGGVLISKQKDLADKARYFAQQAKSSTAYYHHEQVGYNYANSSFSSFLGVKLLKNLDVFVDGRRKVFHRYFKALNEVGSIEFTTEPPQGYANRWLTTVLFKDGSTRDNVKSILAQNGIESRYLWKPLHKQPIFSKFTSCEGNVAESLFEKGLCLPSSHDLDNEIQNNIITLIKKHAISKII